MDAFGICIRAVDISGCLLLERSFWEAKLTANAARDLGNIDELILAGWRVLIVWECATRSAILKKALPELLFNWIEGTSVIGEFGSDSLPP